MWLFYAFFESMPAVDPGFPRGGCANYQPIIFANFPQKLHEIEEIWTEGGRVPGAPLDPPMYNARVSFRLLLSPLLASVKLVMKTPAVKTMKQTNLRTRRHKNCCCFHSFTRIVLRKLKYARNSRIYHIFVSFPWQWNGNVTLKNISGRIGQISILLWNKKLSWLPPASEGWGKVIIWHASVCLFTPTGGTPILIDRGTPCFPMRAGGGTSSFLIGVPHPGPRSGQGVPPSQMWTGSTSSQGVTPHPYLERGYPPIQNLELGYPPCPDVGRA